MLPMIHNSVQAVCYLIERIEIASDGAEISKTVYNVGLFLFLNMIQSVEIVLAIKLLNIFFIIIFGSLSGFTSTQNKTDWAQRAASI